jgi:hypothetical protein
VQRTLLDAGAEEKGASKIDITKSALREKCWKEILLLI